MTLIRIDFKNNNLLNLKKEVVEKLLEWDLDPDRQKLPGDAIACALDDVKLFETFEERNETLEKLELMFSSPVLKER